MEWWYAIVASPVVGAVLNFILKKFITQNTYDKIGSFFYGIGLIVGTACTAGLSKFLKGLWNKTLEPIFLIILNLVFTKFVKGIEDGLLTDNQSLKDGKGNA